jgi:hypothetical protein
VPPSVKATQPDSDQEVSLSELSKTGGLVNAYEAAKMAAAMAGESKTTKPVKMKVKKAKRA